MLPLADKIMIDVIDIMIDDTACCWFRRCWLDGCVGELVPEF